MGSSRKLIGVWCKSVVLVQCIAQIICIPGLILFSSITGQKKITARLRRTRAGENSPNHRALARTGSAWTHPLAGRLSFTRSPSWPSPPSTLPATRPVFAPFPLAVHPLIAVFALRLLVSRRLKHPTAIAHMCSAARCLSNCGPSFKGLVAARLCDAAHCLCNQGSFSIPILLLLLALLPLQAFALVTHASAPGVGTSALKNG